MHQLFITYLVPLIVHSIEGNLIYYAGIPHHGLDEGGGGECRIGEAVGGVIATYLVVTLVAVLFWWRWR